MKQRPYDAVKAALDQGQTTGVAATWLNCQFRLYDDNDPEPDDPEVPHVFSEDEYFMAGIFNWISYDWFEDLGITTREEAVELLIEWGYGDFYWGKANKPDSKMKLKPLKLISVEDNVNPFSGNSVTANYLRVFKPDQTEEGRYKWRWEHFDPEVGGMATDRGEVIITDD